MRIFAATLFVLLISLPVLARAADEDAYYEVSYPASTEKGKLRLDVKYTLWVPGDVAILRGVIVHQHGCGTAANAAGGQAAYDLHWQALARRWDFALLGPMYTQTETGVDGCRLWCDPRNGSYDAFLQALDDFAAQSGHEELKTAPWALWGHSGGGFWASLVQVLAPERVICAYLRSGTAFGFWTSGEVAEPRIRSAAYDIPVLLNPGIKEKENAKPNAAWLGSRAMFEAYRKLKAPIAFAADPKSGHECGDSRYFAIPWMHAAITCRMQDRLDVDQKLRRLDMTKGYVGPLDGDTLVRADMTKEDWSGWNWIPDERSAECFQQYVTTGEVTDATPPPVPTHVRAVRNSDDAIEITWRCEADIASGLQAFVIERDGRPLAQVPEKPVGKYGRPLFQTLSYHDTPELPLPAMRYVDTTAAAGAKPVYRVIAINSVGLKSAPSEPASSRN